MVTVEVWEVAPEVPVMGTVYVPAGVPVGGGGVCEPPPQPTAWRKHHRRLGVAASSE